MIKLVEIVGCVVVELFIFDKVVMGIKGESGFVGGCWFGFKV